MGCLAVLGLSACSLDRIPNDPNTIMTFEQDAVFTKIYATLGTTGQKGPDGNGDVDGIDEGTSAFYRMTWELNEFPTDECNWVWADAGVPDVRIMAWNSSNALVNGVYYRLYFDITLCNHFLAETEGMKDDKTTEQRAEVRLIRALNYWYLLDMFGKVPFVTSISLEDPMPIERKALAEWLVSELKELEAILPAAHSRKSIYRVDQAAAWMLLCRTYLNYNIYAGETKYDEAAIYAKKLIDSPYKLLTTATDHTSETDGFYYSAYQKLFMADNDNNGAQDEAIMLIYQDGNFTQCWGGARFVVSGSRDANMIPFGSSDSWTCIHSTPEFTKIWFQELSNVTEETYKYQTGTSQGKDSVHQILMDGTPVCEHEFDMPAKLGDDRAILCSYYKSTSKDDEGNDVVNESVWDLGGNLEENFYAGWAQPKFTGIASNFANPYVAVTADPQWPDTDLPLMRLAEAYLTYAEAVYRGGATVDGYSKEEAIKALRDRARNTNTFVFNDDNLLDEWAREFWGEGRRRTDLVRFGQFAGPTATRNWEGRGGAKSGASAKKMDAKYNIFPIPYSDITANKNLAGINEANGY